MNYIMVATVKLNKLNKYLRFHYVFKTSRKKGEFVAKIFAAVENNIQSMPISPEVETNLQKDQLDKLNVEDRRIRKPFKIPHGWKKEEEIVCFFCVNRSRQFQLSILAAIRQERPK